MKIFTVFGSASDEYVSMPLCDSLKAAGAVEFAVISAHRNLEDLQEKLKDWGGDVIVAGAGLSAALPGVCASISDRPVFGVAVPAHFGGLDAVASMAQMPFGMPVFSCGAGREKDISAYLQNARDKIADARGRLHFVISEEIAATDYAQKELRRTHELAAEKDYHVTQGAEIEERAFNIIFVTEEKSIHSDAFGLHLPLLDKETLNKPETYLVVYDWMKKGGFWVGANNARNAVLGAERVFKYITEEGKNDAIAGDHVSRVG